MKKQIKLPRCNALDSNGKRCRKHSGIKVQYHGDQEIYRNTSDKKEVHWVEVNFCIDHAIGIGYNFLK